MDLAHRENVIGLSVERDRSCAVHRVEILFDLETRGALLLGGETAQIVLHEVHVSIADE